MTFANPVLVHGEQAHHKPWRAKTALRAVAIHHRLLRGVKCAVSAHDVLRRPNRHAIDRVRETDAAVNSAEVQLALNRFAQHHHAGAAIAFIATFFDAGAV